MLTPAAPEKVSQSSLQRSVEQTGSGMQRALAGSPVQMLLMLQRTAGNQAVNQLLRQYKSSRQPSASLFMPAVQRCGGKACNCSPQEKATHAVVQPLEEEQAQSTSGTRLPSLQRDAAGDDDDDAGDGGTVTADQDSGAAGASEPSAAPDDQDATQSAAADTTDDSSSAEAADDTDADVAPNDAAGDDQSADGDDQSDGDQTDGGADTEDADAGPVEPVPSIAGDGEPIDEVAHGGNNVSLSGLTNAHFMDHRDPGKYTTAAGEDCSGCAAGDCVHVVGTMTSTFTMTTNVSLPTVASNLTDTQKKAVKYAIDNCISPHEQQHVTAYNAYNGTVQTPFDITCCRAVAEDSIKAVHDQVKATRHKMVQDSSDALDPFAADVDLDCEDDADPASCMTCPPSKV